MSREVYLFLRGPLSQWHPSPFIQDGKRYGCAEQFMMEQKACLFGDEAMAARIMATSEPHEQKLMGSRVSGFDDAVWTRHREEIVYTGNRAKFQQNAGLAKKLSRTGDAILAEANPRDLNWGIGLSEDDPRAQIPNEWRGANLLGYILMRVRSEIANGTILSNAERST
ncbi:NADAR family protein [uncultured Maricaulis sp.]|jgi:ribA/ribD-fused uncharacterized protein|uniref:NADAR family protein n=1 Tax=uncultured Maricaulis sp. TaxID=174710 RepID=UPI0025E21CB2|nr:NADAR family protein [uncultured Maricaulis sp.]